MEVQYTAEAATQYQQLPLVVKARVDAVVVRLANWPSVSGVKWLTGPWKQHARIRTGDWRVVFHLASDTQIVIDRLAHRRDAYFD